MVSGSALADARVLVVGASAGIGRGFARHAIAAGADVVLGARRAEVLARVVDEAGGGTAVAVDVRQPEDCARFAAAAAERLGEIDLVLHTAGSAVLGSLQEAGNDTWRDTFSVNVFGANELIKAILPYLSRSAIVGVLSSETATRPRHGLVPYAASKAALEASLAGWRLEHPEVRFCSVVVGATQPTDFGTDFRGAALGDALDAWGRHGWLQRDMMRTDEVVAVLVATLGAALAAPSLSVETMVLRSPSPVVGTFVPPPPAGAPST